RTGWFENGRNLPVRRGAVKRLPGKCRRSPGPRRKLLSDQGFTAAHAASAMISAARFAAMRARPAVARRRKLYAGPRISECAAGQGRSLTLRALANRL